MIRVSPCDRRVLRERNWWVHKSSGYLVTKIDGKQVAFHRYILGAEPGEEVDHKNRVRLDNRRSNLRIVPRTINNLNLGKKTGVHFHKHNRRWVAYIGKTPRVYMGSYGTEADARYVHRCWRNFIFEEVK